MTSELKKYALDKALAVYSSNPRGIQPGNLTILAESFFEFLADKPEAKEETPGNMIDTKPASGVQVTVPHALKELPPLYRPSLKAVIELYHKGERVNGATMARHCKAIHNTMSYHLNRLTKDGYVRRDTKQSYVPVYNWNGEEISAVIRQMPPAFARGYKPATQKMPNMKRAK